jgi:hypothetical protein
VSAASAAGEGRVQLSLSRLLAAPVLTLLALLPSVAWIWQAWLTSPLDAWGWVFLLLGGLWGFLVLDLLSATLLRSPALTAGLDHAGWPCVLGAVLLGIAGLLLDVRIAMASAALGLGWSLVWLLLGGRVALLLVPTLLLGLLALPTTGYLLQQGWVVLGSLAAGLTGGGAWSAPTSPGVLLLKAAVALLALGLGLALAWLGRRDALGTPPLAITAYSMASLLAAVGLLVALNPPAFGPPLALVEDEWSFGPWLGAEIPVTPAEQRLFADSRRLSKRLFSTRDGSRVSVLLVESDDVHDLHTPEYCLSGSGWRLTRDRSMVPDDGLSFGGDAGAAADGPRPPAAGVLTAVRGRQRLAGLYWFSTPERSSGDLAGLRLQRRLSPESRYGMTLVTAVGAAEQDAEETLAAFVRDAPWEQGRTP